MNADRKPGIDATLPRVREPDESRFHRDWPPLLRVDEAMKPKVEKLFGKSH
jgi:hypothetical protein